MSCHKILDIACIPFCADMMKVEVAGGIDNNGNDTERHICELKKKRNTHNAMNRLVLAMLCLFTCLFVCACVLFQEHAKCI